MSPYLTSRWEASLYASHDCKQIATKAELFDQAKDSHPWVTSRSSPIAPFPAGKRQSLPAIPTLFLALLQHPAEVSKTENLMFLASVCLSSVCGAQEFEPSSSRSAGTSACAFLTPRMGSCSFSQSDASCAVGIHTVKLCASLAPRVDAGYHFDPY